MTTSFSTSLYPSNSSWYSSSPEESSTLSESEPVMEPFLNEDLGLDQNDIIEEALFDAEENLVNDCKQDVLNLVDSYKEPQPKSSTLFNANLLANTLLSLDELIKDPEARECGLTYFFDAEIKKLEDADSQENSSFYQDIRNKSIEPIKALSKRMEVGPLNKIYTATDLLRTTLHKYNDLIEGTHIQLSDASIELFHNLSKDRLNHIKEIGEGGFGQVYHYKVNTTPYALKFFTRKPKDKQSEISQIKTMQHEIAKTLNFSINRHPNIIQALAIMPTDDEDTLPFTMILPFYEQGSLSSLIHQKPNTLSAEKVQNYFLQAAKGLTHLHKQGLIHCDFKPGNLLVDKNDHLVIADLGLVEPMDSTNLKGTYEFSPPLLKESAKDQTSLKWEASGGKFDSWSFGATLLYTLAPTNLFSNGNGRLNDFIAFSIACRDSPVTHINSIISSLQQKHTDRIKLLQPNPMLITIVKSCLTVDASLRPSAPQIESKMNAYSFLQSPF